MLKLIHALNMNIESVIDYYNSFDNKMEDLNCYTITMVMFGEKSYYDYINKFDNYLYYLIDDDNPNYIIGYGSIELYDLDESVNINLGNIGYGVRPNLRNKGYGTIILKYLLLECLKLNMKKVYITCLKSNLASQKVIIKNNGCFEKEYFDDGIKKNCLKFFIKL